MIQGKKLYQPPVLQDGTAAHPLHDAAGLRQQCRVGNAQHHIAARVGIVHLFNIDAVAAGRFAVGSGQYLCRAGQHLLRKGKLRLLPGNGGAYCAVDAVFAVDADPAKGVVADNLPFSSPGLPAVPPVQPTIWQATISPLRRATCSPVSLSLMG